MSFNDPPVGRNVEELFTDHSDYKDYTRLNNSACEQISEDSGLTIPIAKVNIRPWFC